VRRQAPRLPKRRRWSGFAAVALITLMVSCSDAGVRLSYDIEAGAKRLGAAEGATITIEHRATTSWPEACTGAYDIEIDRGYATSDGRGNFKLATGAGGLSVRCGDGGGSTTYHLRFVEVPTPLRAHKNADEPAFLELRRERGKALLVGLR
jgi:hypothetical protein